MNVYFYQAECGDAARIHFMGTDGKMHNIFIDAGFERTFRHVLAEQIKSIIESRELIDLWVVSHIHDDHIGGVLKYITAIQDGEFADIVEKWQYNSPRFNLATPNTPQTSLVSTIKSIDQGDYLMEYLYKIGKAPITDAVNESSPQELYGLKLHILSPSPLKLKKLRAKYPNAGFKAFERNELDSISEASSIKGYDYHIPIESFDLTRWKEDDSVENGSSISLLTEYQGKKILWLADSHPKVIVGSLKKLGYSKNNPVMCDWVKVTHHGSKANNSNELYELIRCDNYVISVNGENKHYLPTKECIARILRNSNRPKDALYNFHFTYDNDTLRSIFKVDGDNVFEKWRFKVHYLSQDKWMNAI